MARNSKAAKVRKMLGDGVPPKEIAKRLGIKPQNVYNIKYQASKKQGVGALPKPALIKSGIVTAPRKRSEPNVYLPSVDEFTSPGSMRIVTRAEESDVWKWVTLLVVAVVVGVAIATI